MIFYEQRTLHQCHSPFELSLRSYIAFLFSFLVIPFSMVNNLPEFMYHQSWSCPFLYRCYSIFSVCPIKPFRGDYTLSVFMELNQMKIRLYQATLSCEIRIAILITNDEFSKKCTLTAPRSTYMLSISVAI